MTNRYIIENKSKYEQFLTRKLFYHSNYSRQDSLPAKPFGVIKAQVEFELGKPLQSVFSHVDEIPLACASIAQV